MIHAATPPEIAARRRAFIRKWRPQATVAESLEEAGDRLFTFAQAGESIAKCAHCDAIERLHEEFKRRIKTQIVLSSAGTAAMLYWAPLASDQINMRKVDSWQTLAKTTHDQPIYLAAGIEDHRGRSRTASRPPRTNFDLDHDETRSWHGWHRHVSLVMLAFAMMAAIQHQANKSVPKKPSRTQRQGTRPHTLVNSGNRRIAQRLARKRIQPANVIAWSLWRGGIRPPLKNLTSNKNQ